MKAWLFPLLIVIAVLLAGCAGPTSLQGPAPQPTTDPTRIPLTVATAPESVFEEKDGFAILSFDYDREKIGEGLYMVDITGKAKNVGTAPISRAEIRVKFKFLDGTVFATQTKEILDLQPGEVWQFGFVEPVRTSADNYEVYIGDVEK